MDASEQPKKGSNARPLSNISALEDQNNSFPCSECGQSFKSLGGMKQHRTKMHSASVDKKSSNGLAEREASLLTSEIKDQNNSFPCSECGQSFKSLGGMKQHRTKMHAVSVGHNSTKGDDSSSNGSLERETYVVTPDIQVDQNNSFSRSECGHSFKSLGGMKQQRPKMHAVSVGHNSSINSTKGDDSSSNGSPERETSVVTPDIQATTVKVDVSSSIGLPVQEQSKVSPDIQDHNNLFPCSECGQSFKSLRGMKQHRTKMHSASMDSSNTYTNGDDCSSFGLPGRETLLVTKDSQDTKKHETELHSISVNRQCLTTNGIADVSSSDALPGQGDSNVSPDIEDQNNSFPCSECGQSFRSLKGMKQHRTKMHPVSVDQHSSNTNKTSDDCSSDGLPEREIFLVTPDIQDKQSIDCIQSMDDMTVLYSRSDSFSEDDSFQDDIQCNDSIQSMDETTVPYSRSNSFWEDDSFENEQLTDSRKMSSPFFDCCDQKVNKLKLAKGDVGAVSSCVIRFSHLVLQELRKKKPNWGWQRFNTGSYYDRTKNNQPDEFDVMLYPKNVLVEVDFENSRSVVGFYKVKLKSPRFPDLQTFAVDKDGYITPGKFKAFVFGLFDEIMKSPEFRHSRHVTRKERSDDNSPAYTIVYRGIPGKPVDIDLVPCFRIEGWPPIARKIDPKWISQDNVINRATKYYDVVCKTCPEDVKDANSLWRLSFSYTEKKLINYAADKNKSSTKKKVFKIMKSYIEDIRAQHPNEVTKFCSYHIKHFMLYQYDDWRDAKKSTTTSSLLQKLISMLSSSPPLIKNYFVMDDNVVRNVPTTEIGLIVECLQKEYTELQKKL